MKKILTKLLLFTLIFSLTSCGSVELLKEFNTEATIEKTTIYDENNVRITANELTYNNFSAELSVTIENNSDKDLSILCGSAGYHVNSVNGYMIDDGYLNCDVKIGQSLTEEISFDFASLNACGITEIADIEVGFDISGEDNESIYTGPLKINTSLAESYDYSKNRYYKVIDNGEFEKKFDCKVNYFSKDKLYENYNVSLTSATVVTNVNGETMLLLEVENNSNGRVFVNTKEIYVNDCLVYEPLWSSDGINANKKYLKNISLSNLIEKYKGDISDVSKISDISFTFTVGENWYESDDSQKISISLPNIEISSEDK